MTENIQNGLISELFSILKLVTGVVIKKLNLQHLLFFTAFITFGIGDGITAAYMMKLHGAGIEANPITRYLFTSNGFNGVIFGKVWLTLMLLFVVHIIQITSPDNMFWTINGFLTALTAGGIMAVHANMSVLTGNIPAAPGEIIFAYLFLVFVLTQIGSIVDRHAPGQGSV